MKGALTALASLFLSTSALALPTNLWCHNTQSDGSIVWQRFEFVDTGRDIFPPQYNVHLLSEWLKHPATNPDQPISSSDPNVHGDWVTLLDVQQFGTRDENDQNLIHFEKGGYISLGRGSAGDITATYQLPGAELPQTVGNCSIPEPGMTVHI